MFKIEARIFNKIVLINDILYPIETENILDRKKDS